MCYFIVYECGMVFLSAHLDAMLLTKFTREYIIICSHFFEQSSYHQRREKFIEFIKSTS